MTREPTIAEPAPDWARIDEEIRCPLCSYNLRGLAEPRCPECGYRFAWPEMLDPTRRRHPYLFEHHPERRVWSFCKTVLGGLRPGRFWRRLHPTQPSHPRRLVQYWGLSIGFYLICLAGWYVAALTHDAAKTAARNAAQRASETTFLSSPQGAAVRRRIVQDFGSVQAYLNRAYPTSTRQVIRRRLQQELGLHAAFLVVLTPVVWPWLTFAALMVFQISMRRARVRAVHVLRCALYSSDAVLWMGLAMVPVAGARFVLTGSPSPSDEMVLGLAGLCLALGLLVVVRLVMAYKHYLRFDHPLATVLASQIIVLLAWFNALLAVAVWL